MKPITYPARPVNGGPFHLALPKNGEWFCEAKYNGWRAHGSPKDGILYNRHNKPLSIGTEFAAALTKVRNLPFEWLDYEALERRHNIGRGSLIILDCPKQPGTYKQRREYLYLACAVAGIKVHDNLHEPIPDNSVVLAGTWAWGGAHQLYHEILPRCNKESFGGKIFYEGIVAKRADSIYPMQLRSADTEFPFWMKHRWAF